VTLHTRWFDFYVMHPYGLALVLTLLMNPSYWAIAEIYKGQNIQWFTLTSQACCGLAGSHTTRQIFRITIG